MASLEPELARFQALRLSYRTDLLRRIAFLVIAMTFIGFGTVVLGLLPGSPDLAPLGNRGSARSIFILASGFAMLIGAVLLLLRDQRLIPAAVAIRIRGRVLLAAIGFRAPLAVLRVGETVAVSSARHDTDSWSLVKGSFVWTWYDWRVTGETRHVAWGMGQVMPPEMARDMCERLERMGLRASSVDYP